MMIKSETVLSHMKNKHYSYKSRNQMNRQEVEVMLRYAK